MAQLTEQEKQEIIRFLEAGKALPDKYRFLLYDFVYIDQKSFEKYRPTSFRQVLATFREYKPTVVS